MFNKQTARPKTVKYESLKTSQFTSARNAKTSHSRRSNLEKDSKQTTLSY